MDAVKRECVNTLYAIAVIFAHLRWEKPAKYFFKKSLKLAMGLDAHSMENYLKRTKGMKDDR